METVFYIVRHGKTLFNKLERFQGVCDSPLLPESIELAKTLYKGLYDIDFALAVSSTSERAIDTMECILQDRDVKRVYRKDLKEINFGNREGSLLEFSTPPQIIEERGFAFCGGEDRKDAGERFMNGLREVAVEGNVLVVTHSAVEFYLLQQVNPELEFFNAGEYIPHCSVAKILLKDGQFSLLEMPTLKYNK